MFLCKCNLEFSLLGIVPDTLPQLQTRLKELKQKAPTHPELAPEISQLEQQIQLENSFLEDSTISLRRMKFNYLPFIYKTFDILARHHPKEFSKLIKQALV
ncbi:hypothetical protein HMI55_006451 [Coelomomyces lativittatus]|nr:hypothetical protein HMI55_006451 [Coelomomyces lativittatus]